MHHSNLIEKWNEDILNHGYTVLPNLLIRNAGKLQLTAAQFQVLVTIESFRWDDSHPWPSQQSIADIMGYNITSICRITTELEDMGLLRKIRREGRSCMYDMEPLIEELEMLA